MASTICKKEILMDILVRLPAKTLMRFLCACKAWSDMISSPDFVSKNLNTNFTKRKNMHLICLHKLLVDTDDPDDDQPIWSFFHYETFEQGLRLSHPSGSTEHYGIYGSSIGLVCISHTEEGLSCRSPIIIWNPSINKFKTLPSSTNNKFRYMSLQFGYHPGDNDYKVVRMIWFNKDVFAVEVYSLSSNSWKIFEEIPPWLKYNFKHHEGTFINGVAYRILEKHYMYTLMSFDSVTEEFEEFILPESIINSHNLHLHSFEEKPCLMSHWYCSDEEDWDRDEFWVLEDKRWKRNRPFYYPKNGYSTMGVIDDNVLMKKNDYRNGVVDLFFVNYETREDRTTGIKLAITRIGYEEVFYVFPYTESLVLLN
ncbi:PREDICTED: putative F-box protein At1g32420 [Fragaria vesca subsp. vesca]|uniref:putative F-box protein At1g32420 n=1 Tax=Fragaria vesca subsp. vesca TaxID=101020 RepID=UPI0002C31634|nr:PREDICTED: putative F-box protein At1g32420 [Fragaria vesca subsp. vesca]